MPLKITVPCSGEMHTLDVSIDDDDDMTADITHEEHDREYDEAAQEFGYQLPECYHYCDRIEGYNIADVLMHKVLRPSLLKAISEQGIKALGLSEEDFASIVIDQILETNPWVWGDWDIVMRSIDQALMWFKDTKAFVSSAPAMARKAYDNEDTDFFRTISKMFGSNSGRGMGLLRVEEEEDEEQSESGLGSATNIVTARVFIDDIKVDEWTFGFVGWFDCISSMYWRVKPLDSSDYATYATESFLKAAGWPTGSEEIEDTYKPEEPCLPPRGSDGDWVILHDAYRWGYFKSEDDALDVYNAMRDASTAGYGGSFDIELTLLHRTKTPDGRYEIWKDDPFDDDDSGRDKDGYFWEIIGSDSI